MSPLLRILYDELPFSDFSLFFLFGGGGCIRSLNETILTLPRQELRVLNSGPKTIFFPFPLRQGSIFWSENNFYSLPLLKMIFVPLLQHVVFRLPFWPFCPNSSPFCIYFTLLLPLSSFSFPFLPFLQFPSIDIGWGGGWCTVGATRLARRRGIICFLDSL